MTFPDRSKVIMSSIPTSAPTLPARQDQAVYRRIEVDLRLRISRGEWPDTGMLPSRRDLAKHYGVSPLTVERAVTCLIADGLLRTDDRRGTFVVNPGNGEITADRRSSNSPNRNKPSSAATVGIAGSLFVQRTDHLELNNYWVRMLVQSIEAACASDGNTSLFFNRICADSATVRPLSETVAEARRAGVDAIAIIGIGHDPRELEESMAELASAHLPSVSVSASVLNVPVPNVSYDNYGAGYQAGQHLISSGCRDILVFAPQVAPWVLERIAGVYSAADNAEMRERILTLPIDAVAWNQQVDPAQNAYEAAQVALRHLVKLPDGVVCIQDQAAFGFMKAASELGLRVGEDYAIIGFDDHPHSRSVHLTSLRPPMEAMGREASRLLRKFLHGDEVNAQVCLRWHLIGRQSTAIQKATVQPRLSDAIDAASIAVPLLGD
jgi:DNA-binding LacI/PurR family transcriptional regulator/DNA-binding transcriptional regulator YhcF (GntR family)